MCFQNNEFSRIFNMNQGWSNLKFLIRNARITLIHNHFSLSLANKPDRLQVKEGQKTVIPLSNPDRIHRISQIRQGGFFE